MRVLIIDDDPIMRAGCSKILERSGFACTAVENGTQALECVRRAAFDVALLDLKIPRLLGMETLKKLRDESPNTAIIIVTGYASIDSSVEAVKAGAFDYLPKPLAPEVLTMRVRRAVHAVRNALEESLIRRELERKNLERSNALPPVMGRVARLIQGVNAAADDSPGSLARLEAAEIRNALRQFRGNKTRTAERLGINRKTLREKMLKYGITDVRKQKN